MTWPKGRQTRDDVTADALDRYWDSLLAPTTNAHPGGPSHPDELLDPGLTRTVRQLRFSEEAPRPDSAFAARLWADLSSANPTPEAASPVVAGMSQNAGRILAWPRHRFLVELTVAAALLVAVLGGGVALKLPVSLAPGTAPTAAASAGGPNAGEGAVRAACLPTVTPEPTSAPAATAPVSTLPPVPTMLAGPDPAC